MLPIPTPLPTAPVLHPIRDVMGDAPVVNIDDTVRSVKYFVNAPFDLAMHFLFSSIVGLLAYYLTSTMSYLAVLALAGLLPSGRFQPARLDSYINLFSWSVALSLGLASHLWWDALF